MSLVKKLSKTPRGGGGQDNMMWVRLQKGTNEKPDIQPRLVVRDSGYGKRVGDLFAGTLSLTIVKLLLFVAAERGLALMLVDEVRLL